MKRDDPMGKGELLVGVSVWLSLFEAVRFKDGLDSGEKYYLLKVAENPKARRIAKRERYMVVRHPRKWERVPASYRVFANRGRMV